MVGVGEFGGVGVGVCGCQAGLARGGSLLCDGVRIFSGESLLAVMGNAGGLDRALFLSGVVFCFMRLYFTQGVSDKAVAVYAGAAGGVGRTGIPAGNADDGISMVVSGSQSAFKRPADPDM